VAIHSNSNGGAVTVAVLADCGTAPDDALPVSFFPYTMYYLWDGESIQDSLSVQLTNTGKQQLQFTIVDAPDDLIDFVVPTQLAPGDTTTLIGVVREGARDQNITKSITIDIDEYQ